MGESWDDLLCRVYQSGYEDRQRERDYDPIGSEAVNQGIRRAAAMENRIWELESALAAIIEYDDKGYGQEYIRAIDDAKELLGNNDG